MKYLKTIIFYICIFLILNLITTIFYYFNITNENANNIFKFITFIITYLLTGIYIGRRSEKKAYLEGIKISSIITIFSILIIILSKTAKFSVNTFIVFIILYLITIIGSIIGINFKVQKK